MKKLVLAFVLLCGINAMACEATVSSYQDVNRVANQYGLTLAEITGEAEIGADPGARYNVDEQKECRANIVAFLQSGTDLTLQGYVSEVEALIAQAEAAHQRLVCANHGNVQGDCR